MRLMARAEAVLKAILADSSRQAHQNMWRVFWPTLAKFCQIFYASFMTTMNISLPDALKAFVDQKVSASGYGTASEYVRELIRRDKDRGHLRSLLLEGAESPVTGEADSDYFESLRGGIRQRLSPQSK